MQYSLSEIPKNVLLTALLPDYIHIGARFSDISQYKIVWAGQSHIFQRFSDCPDKTAAPALQRYLAEPLIPYCVLYYILSQNLQEYIWNKKKNI